MRNACFWRAVLIVVVCVALAMPARAESIQAAANEAVIGIIVVSAAVAVLITVLILHHKSKKEAITGCVKPGASGMIVTDEKDRQIYALAGDTARVKAGDRMKLAGKRKSQGTTLTFETRKVIRDFGVCQP